MMDVQRAEKMVGQMAFQMVGCSVVRRAELMADCQAEMMVAMMVDSMARDISVNNCNQEVIKHVK